MKTNYHIHNELCKHAFGTVMEYSDAAYAAGYDIIGMSDHGPYEGDKFGFRMEFNELPEYIRQVQQAKDKYKGKMDVVLGLEIEYLFGCEKYYEQLFTKYGMEYLILGQHFYNDRNNHDNISYVYDLGDTKTYVEYANSIKSALSTGYYSLVAHPDLIFVHDNDWDDNCERACDIIIDAAIKYDVPLELNANGVRKGMSQYKDGFRYPYPHFKLFDKIAKTNIPVMVNADCHLVKEIDDEAMTKSFELAKEKGLNLIEKLRYHG